MKKRFLGALFALCMTFTLLPVSAMAVEPDYVAQIGETGYTSLQDAVDAVDAGQTIELLDNITLTASVTIASGNEDFTIDLNGCTLSGGSNVAIRHSGSGTLTITDSSAGGLGKVTGATTGVYDGTIYLEGGTADDIVLIITGATVESTGTGSAVYSNSNSGVNILGASKVKNTGIGRAICSTAAGKITISGTALVTSDNIHSTIFLGEAWGVALEITGGTVENTSTDGYAIYSALEGVVSIPSGTSVIKGDKVMNKAPDLSSYTDVYITASSSDKNGIENVYEVGKSQLDMDSVVELFKYLKFEPAVYVAQIGETGYTSLQNAIDAVADGDTIKLLKDTAESIYIPDTFTHSFTIDLNSFTLSSISGLAMEYKGTGILTITDSSSAGGGTITASSDVIQSNGNGKIRVSGKATVSSIGWHAVYIVGGEAGDDVLEITGGAVESSGSYAIVNRGDGTVTVSGGSITGSAGIESTYNTGDIIISGGTVKGSSYAIYTSGNVIITGGMVESTGNNAAIYCSNSSKQIIIPGGTVVVKGGSKAMNKPPVLTDYTSYQWRILSSAPFTPCTTAPYVWSLSDRYVELKPYTAPNTYAVTLPNDTGFSVTTQGGSSSPVAHGGSFSFTVAITGGYHKGGSFTVKANGASLTANDSGVYTISNITQAQTVTVEGVEQDIPAPTPSPTPSADTVYNDPSKPDATIWLTGSGFADDDLLITQALASGSNYNAMLKLADGNDVLQVYQISLQSGTKSTGSAMYLTFELTEKYAGQAFTLIHKKADGTFEYLYATADSDGNVKFGPLYELSPFMLVKGTLLDDLDDIPKAGDDSSPWVWWLLGGVSAVAVILLGIMGKRKERN